MSNRINTCIYVDKEILETARRLGLNISRVSENALKNRKNPQAFQKKI